ncbi:hypothetical protein GCM10025867_05350 [Frondihabitans sucicola]|uniref:Uncharacterized protein n=1 Tax=Frondihabitans sucicola TaxID=1268041 RepID=A0ABN6XTR4_9MICO|nr:hypothetical protein GCM10025867_05350 [Frondihabitans sucicola]
MNRRYGLRFVPVLCKRTASAPQAFRPAPCRSTRPSTRVNPAVTPSGQLTGTPVGPTGDNAITPARTPIP